LHAGGPVRVAAALLLAAIVTTGGAVARAADGTLYAGPEADPAFGELAPELVTALFPEHRLALAPAADAEAALDHVAQEPGAVAIADLATMLDYVARHPDDSAQSGPAQPGAAKLEFHGQLSRHCLLAFARRGGWVHDFADIAGAGGAPRPTVGLVGPDAAVTLAELRRLDPGIADFDLRPGTAADLAGRAAHGSLDLLLMVAHAGFDDATAERLADDDRLVELPVVTRLLARAAATGDSGFALAMSHPASDLPWVAAPPMTLCTPVGVVLRSDAPPALRDAVVAAAARVAAMFQKPGFLARVSTAAKSALHDAAGSIRDLLGPP
jgi:hypothetical protein